MKFIFQLIILILITGCKSEEVVVNFNVTKYLKVKDGFVFSDDVIKYNNSTYWPRLREYYINKKLTKASVFKPLGELDYDISYFNEDTLLKKSLKLIEERVITFNKNTIKDNSISRPINEIILNKIYCINFDTLLIYQINK